MAIRRLMMMGLTNYVRNIIDDFQARLKITFGIYQADNCIYNQLNRINQIDLLDNSAKIIATPNAYNEGILHTAKSYPISSAPYNLMTYTESFYNWSLNAVTRATTSTSDPFGITRDVVLLSENTANSAHRLNSQLTTIASSGFIYTGSLYVKKGTGGTAPDIVQLYLLNGFNVASYANFNINTGIVTAANLCTATISNSGLFSGWWRCTLTITSTVETTNCSLNFAFTNNNPTATRAPSYVGAITSNVLIFGAQLELSESVRTYQQIDSTATLQQGYTEFLRSSTATITESNGLIQEVPYQNILSRSEEFEYGVWIKNTCTISINSTTSPDGLITADLMTANVGSINPSIVRVPSTLAGQSYLISIYAKANTNSNLQIRYYSATLPNNYITAIFNLTNGLVTQTSVGSAGGTLLSANISNVGNGWYRCSIIGSITTSGTQFSFSQTRFPTGNIFDGSGIVTNGGSFSGNESIFIWGAQMTMSNVAIEYFPTIIRNNVPRLDYTSNSCPVILIEGGSTNLLLRSEDFGNSSWITSSITVTTDVEISPDGLVSGDTLLATSNNAYITQSAQGAVNNTSRIFSVYLKRKTGSGVITLVSGDSSKNIFINSSTWTRQWVVNNVMPGTYSATGTAYTVTTTNPHGLISGDAIRFDSTSGTAVDQSIATITVTSSTQFTFTGTSVTSTGSCNIISNSARIIIADSGDEVYAWGAQFEVALTNISSTSQIIPSSYIPTTGSSVSRSTDTLTSNAPKSSASTFYGKIKRVGGTNNINLPFILISDTTTALSTNAILCTAVTNGTVNWYYRIGSTTTNLSTSSIYSPPENEYFTFLVMCDDSASTRFSIWMDGTPLSISTIPISSVNLKYLQFVGNSTIMSLSEYVTWDRVLTSDEINLLFSYPYFYANYSPINVELQCAINRAYAEGFTIPGSTLLSHLDTLITQMKNDGIWELSDLFENFTYNDTNLSDWSRINLKNPNSKFNSLCTIFGGMTYRVDGFKGNGTDGYISTNLNASLGTPYKFTTNNAGRMMVFSEDVGNSQPYDGNTGANNRLFSSTSSTSTVRINSVAALPVSVNTTGNGFKGLMRDDSNNIRLQILSSVTTTTQLSSSITNNNQLILRGLTTYGNGCVSCYWLGASLTNSQMANFRIYYNQYLTNIGLTAFA